MIRYKMACFCAGRDIPFTILLVCLLACTLAMPVHGAFSPEAENAQRQNGASEEKGADEEKVRRAAIFVRSRVPELDNRVGVLQDLLTSRITSKANFSVISRENVINSVRTMADDGPNVGHDVDPEKDLDRLLSNRASALRLAQLLQADYILIATIVSYHQDTHHIQQRDINQRIRTETLLATYEILDTSLGGTLASSVANIEKRTRLSGGPGRAPDRINELLDDASKELASALADQVRRKEIRQGEGRPELVPLTVTCTIEDLTIPDVVRDENGEWVVVKDRRRMVLMDVNIEVNGVVEGSAPGTVRVEPGLSKLRLSREGFRDVERTINLRQNGLELSVALQMTDENRQRMLENMAFFEDLRINQKLTDAHVEVLEGYAQMLRQSGYRVDIEHSITIDTDEPPRIEKTVQSFWAN